MPHRHRHPDRHLLPALIGRTTVKVGTPSAAGERAWLDAFFDVRIDDLTNPANSSTAEEWRKSVDRVECLRRIAATGNYDLDGPLAVTAFGSSYTISRAARRNLGLRGPVCGTGPRPSPI
ncbi:chitosanase [Kitasatospora sp. NPDC094028]